MFEPPRFQRVAMEEVRQALALEQRAVGGVCKLDPGLKAPPGFKI